tara:strand:+ start:1021 stop:1842 length:822 start_codon:yes stop_codon:yes gene_type:complete
MKELLITPQFAATHATQIAEARKRMDIAPNQSVEDTGRWYREYYRARRSMTVNEGVANIHVYGMLGTKFDPVYRAVGLVTDYGDILAEINKAINDPEVFDILLDMESGGGYAMGAPELADAILALRDSEKTIYSYSDDLNCSAAYYISCGADYSLASVDAAIGSIGTRMGFGDYVGMMERQGVTMHEFEATGADLKAAGSPHHKPTEEEVKFFQESIDQTNAAFKAHVMACRPGIDAEVFRAGFYSGEVAVDLGLVDYLVSRQDIVETIISLR